MKAPYWPKNSNAAIHKEKLLLLSTGFSENFHLSSFCYSSLLGSCMNYSYYTTARSYHCFLVLQLFEAEQHAFNTLFSNLHFKSSLLADKILDYASFRDILFTQKDYQLCQLRM